MATARTAFRLALISSTMLAALASPALAQTVAAPATAAAAEDVGDDIVVTAQRRAERVQDIPLSVSAISGDALKNAAVTDVERIEQLVPGVRFGRSGAALRPAIRGTYTENVAVNGDPRIGIYVDDIYQSRTQQIPPIVDLDRVEVQKGPQGTLYGRNSFGGNIAFNSALPKNEFAAGIDALYGRYNHIRGEAFVNLPISDGVALRIAGMGEQSDGYIRNRNPNGNDAGDNDQAFVRGTLRIAPSNIEGLEVLLRGSYLWQGGNGIYGFGYKEVGVLVDRDLIRQPGGSITRNGVTYNFPNGFNGQSWTGTPLNVDSRYRDGIPDVNGVDVGIPVDADPYVIDFAGKTFRRTRQHQWGGTISYDVGAVKLRSITSYTDFNNLVTGNSLTPVQLNFSYIRTRAKTFTQEVQLLSSDTTSPFQYIVGGYYYNDNITEHNVTNVNRAYNTVGAPAGQKLYNWGFTALPTLANGTTVGNIDQTFAYDSLTAYQQKIKSLAAYGQLSYTFAEKLTVTGGIRYTSDRKTQLSSRFNTFPGSSPLYYAHSIDDPINYTCGGLIAANSASNAPASAIASAYNFVCNNLTQDFVTWRAAVDYKFSRDHMIYASVSTGAHSGGFNTGVVNIGGVNTLLAFAPEYVTAYEIGTKNTLLDGKLTLNAAAFLNNFRDLQAQTSIPNPANPAAVLALVQNIGKDRAYGVDLEMVARPTPNLTFNLAFNWLHAREIEYAVNTFNFGGIASFCSTTVTPDCNLSTGEQNTVQGTPFPNVRTDPNRFVPVVAPDGSQVTVGGVPQWRYVIAGKGRDGTVYQSRKAFQPDYTVQVGIAYRIDMGDAGSLTPEVQTYFSSDYILTDLTPDFGNQKAFTRTDLRLTWRSADERFRIQAFVNNIEDTAVITRAVYASNRTLQASFAIPRTYGVQAGFKF
ncbi:TonB-dependent receptor [Sandaracinobacteroides saxicola]|uniref:TonB-dependent receptor n=1 Tax=Sandaracinobacteroides saxicola TaxID=2759707 RepID=A0A7G5IEU6_9SPHN|nr:TonB-dependent receptor [Sandaracinobacteroides saxicola]QMW21888.1 TonB-dependent receptor [Sandaracinobacteroides saxicola]